MCKTTETSKRDLTHTETLLLLQGKTIHLSDTLQVTLIDLSQVPCELASPAEGGIN